MEPIPEDFKCAPTTGRSVHIDVPRPNIYVNAKPSCGRSNRRFKVVVGSHHFNIRLGDNDGFTQEKLDKCDGVWSCHNCAAPIMGRVYLCPLDRTLTNEFITSQLPYCRPSCVLRAIHDQKPQPPNMLTLFPLMYGPNVTCAPPRMLLYLPGGMNLADYHATCDRGMVMSEDVAHVRSVRAPIYLGGTLMRDNQMINESVEYVDEIQAERCKTVGQSRVRDNENLTVIPLQPSQLINTPISRVFPHDTNSFGRPGLVGNPHMMSDD